MARIVSLQVGKPQTQINEKGTSWTSAIAKSSVSGPIQLRRENLDGDVQANRKYHGGPDKAICVYASEHYALWRTEFARPEMPFGSFGENLTLEGLTEESICIGDIYTVPSGATIQVCQPRVPCANVRHNWSAPKLPARMKETGYTGFYVRVLVEGTLSEGDTLTRTERPCPEWNLLRVNNALYGKKSEARNAERVALCLLPPLSRDCVRHVRRLLSWEKVRLSSE